MRPRFVYGRVNNDYTLVNLHCMRVSKVCIHVKSISGRVDNDYTLVNLHYRLVYKVYTHANSVYRRANNDDAAVKFTCAVSDG